MTKPLAIHLFGPVRIVRAGRDMSLSTRRERALLVYLALLAAPVSRQRLAVRLWSDAAESEALTRLRRLLHRMTRLLGDDVLRIDRQQIGFAEEARATVDIVRFRALLAQGLFRPERELDAVHVAALEQAAALGGRELADGLIIDECDELAAWLEWQRESLRQTYRQLLARLAAYYERRRDYARALDHAQTLVAADPLNEPSQRQLMRLYAASGEVSAALRQFERCRSLLWAELGIEPDAETTRLDHELRARSAAPIALDPSTADIRFVASGGVHLAYQTVGSQDVDVLYISGFVSNIEQLWEEGGPSDFFRALAAHARLILFDRRGVGSSDRVVGSVDVSTSVADAVAVLDAVRSRNAVVFAVSEGGPIAIRLAVEHPDRVAGLVLWGTTAVGTAAPGFPWALTSDQFEQWAGRLIAEWGRPTSIQAFAPEYTENPALRRWWARMLRLGSSPGCMRAVLRTLATTDVRDVLADVRVPTVVMHRRGDRAVRVEAGRFVAERIPGARWIELPGNAHWWWLGDWQPIVETIVGLLDKR